MSGDYPLEALDILLDRSCLPERYHPLIPHKTALLSGLRRRGCGTKSDAAGLSDEDYRQMGVDPDTLRLFRRFLALYDQNPQKFREIDALVTDPSERAAFQELYRLPGVKFVRASLYYRAGYRSLQDFANTTPEEVLARTARTIAAEGLSCALPLPKEVRTHIAVAKAFTWKTPLAE